MNLHSSFCCCFIVEQKQKNKVNKRRRIDRQSNVCSESIRTLRSLSELHGMPDVKTNCKHEVWNWMTVIPCAHFTLVCTTFLKIYFYCYLLLWKYLYIQEVTFLRQHDSMIFILGQNRIFRVIDAKTQPKLNTVQVIPLGAEPMIFWLWSPCYYCHFF